LLPTILAATGVTYPSEIGNSSVQALDGENLLPLLEGADWHRGRPIFWEHEGNAAVRLGTWKLVRKFGSDWQLYDMERDRTELDDLGAAQPADARSARARVGWLGRVHRRPRLARGREEAARHLGDDERARVRHGIDLRSITALASRAGDRVAGGAAIRVRTGALCKYTVYDAAGTRACSSSSWG
jgi:hypothetical protein